MKSILEELYYGNLSGNDIKLPKVKEDRELNLYNELNSKLSENDKNLFNDFIEEFSNRTSTEQKESYILGFKTGILLGLEITEKEDL